jgi:hypothetical protein
MHCPPPSSSAYTPTPTPHPHTHNPPPPPPPPHAHTHTHTGVSIVYTILNLTATQSSAATASVATVVHNTTAFTASLATNLAASSISVPSGYGVTATAAVSADTTLVWVSPWDAPAGLVYISGDSSCISENNVCDGDVVLGPRLTFTVTWQASEPMLACHVIVRDAILPNGTYLVRGGAIQSGFRDEAPALYGAGVNTVPSPTSNSEAAFSVHFSPLYIRSALAMSVVLEAACSGTHTIGPTSSGMFHRPCDACPAGLYREDCDLKDTTFRSAGSSTCRDCAAGRYKISDGTHDSVCEECSSLPPCPHQSYRVGCGPTSVGSCATCEYASTDATTTCRAMLDPTNAPTAPPTTTMPTKARTTAPTTAPTAPTNSPTNTPTKDGATPRPTKLPTNIPSHSPTAVPTPVPCPSGKHQVSGIQVY